MLPRRLVGPLMLGDSAAAEAKRDIARVDEQIAKCVGRDARGNETRSTYRVSGHVAECC